MRTRLEELQYDWLKTKQARDWCERQGIPTDLQDDYLAALEKEIANELEDPGMDS